MAKKVSKKEKVEKVSKETGVDEKDLERLPKDALKALDEAIPDEDETEEESSDVESDSEENEPELEKKAPKPSPKKESTKKEKVEKVQVLSQVNMTCLDGTQLRIGEHAYISKAEYERLKKDKRKEFFKE